MELLKRECTVCVVGAFEALEPVNNMLAALHRKQVAAMCDFATSSTWPHFMPRNEIRFALD
jgi:hypothetical protein